MPAYVICDVDVTNPEAYEEYKRLSAIACEAAGGRFIVRGGEVAVLEGDWDPSRIVVLEFPSVDAAKAWYKSKEYQAAKAARAGAAISRFIAVPGA
jgi:uncharacterized protein (DUF1330 family)